MANFIGLVYATLKNEGVDTKGMSTDEAVEKFKELQKKSGGGSGEKGATPAEQRKLEQKGVVDKKVETYDLSESDTTIIDDAIYWVKRNGDNLTVDNVIKQINEDMGGFLPDKKEPKYNAILDYIKEKGGNEDTSNNIDYENVNYPKGTSKEYTNMVNEKYQNALSTLEQFGISVKDFGGQKSQEGGYEDNTREIMEKYVFEPFRQKYPNGNNEAWKKEFEPIYNAIDAVNDKLYNDFYIKNN